MPVSRLHAELQIRLTAMSRPRGQTWVRPHPWSDLAVSTPAASTRLVDQEAYKLNGWFSRLTAYGLVSYAGIC